jgi:hypothetical protein
MTHPSIFMPRRPQELHYFDLDANYRRGTSWYASHFTEVRSHHEAVGQTSPLYIYEPHVPGRIAELLPEVKLIFILRDPVARAYSHYWHEVKKGRETLGFEEALSLESQRLRQGARERRVFSYIDRGRYRQQLQRYLDQFAPDQLLLLLMEEMSADPVATINQCCVFVGVRERGQEIVDQMPRRRYNVSRLPRSRWLQQFFAPWRARSALVGKLIDYINLQQARYPALSPELRNHLQDLFEEDYQYLTTVFKLDLSLWRQVAQRV